MSLALPILVALDWVTRDMARNLDACATLGIMERYWTGGMRRASAAQKTHLKRLRDPGPALHAKLIQGHFIELGRAASLSVPAILATSLRSLGILVALATAQLAPWIRSRRYLGHLAAMDA